MDITQQVRAQVHALTHPDSARQRAAWLTLLAFDETAVPPLIDVFYAGLPTPTGSAVVHLVAAIGGWEARLFLREVAQYERSPWREIAARWLAHAES